MNSGWLEDKNLGGLVWMMGRLASVIRIPKQYESRIPDHNGLSMIVVTQSMGFKLRD